ncbi:hypothetical protein [Marinilabilia salmonicolor]|jgi:hypothetical protein|uniref:Uncharacterized protein n=1 Tax=Marinilabilia salmonicolor TaxID=989 RepID=A0A2T0WXF3_9BACT|nr:hypothetical protein [Marinilabilia salmonicolor]PRY91380.1 hypothetical protein BY457_12528 [Marinilabilia salmonicolor]PRY96710.1 hypothetical protein BY457_11495 [Marinilabilia salmonicolor]RCW39033.1 hypothetical protein DFO77_102187 [Marinilabilia salmonicolor]
MLMVKDDKLEYDGANNHPDKAKVNFVVWWKKEEDTKEIKILLPQIRFKNSKSGTIPAG